MAKCIQCLGTGCEGCGPKEVKVSESPSLTGLDPSPVMWSINLENLLEALRHLNEAQHPKVQYLEIQELMTEEAISNMKLSIGNAIDLLKQGQEDYFKDKGV